MSESKTTGWAKDLSIARALTWRYVIALSLVAMLSTAAWVSLHLVISEQKSTAAVVNVSGRQRMLSQRTALFANLLVNAPVAERPAIRSSLKEAIELMARSHRGLTRGDPELGLPESMSPAVHALYFDEPEALDRQVETYIQTVQALLQQADDALTPDNPQLQYITRTAPTTLVAALDQMVRQYQQEGEAAVGRLQQAETIFWLVTLLLLLLEALLIFHPFVRHVRSIVGKLQQLTEQLRQHQSHLEELVMQRTADLESRSKQLADSEEKFRLISTTAQDAIAIIGPDEQVIYWNPAAETIFGYKADEVIGKNLHDLLIPVGSQDAAHSGFRRFQNTGQGKFIGKTFEISALRKSGEEFPIELSISAFRLHNSWHALGIIRDITERKRAEEQLRQQNQFSEDIVNSLPGIFYMLNQHGRFVRVNKLFLEVTGYAPDDIERMTALDFFEGEDRSLIAGKMQEVFALGDAWAEADLIVKSGQKIPYYFTGHRTCIDGQPYLIGLGTDITERRALEQEMVRQARTDSLTGLSNRRYFRELAGKELARASRYGQTLSVLMLDLDKFKGINDTHGHQTGDQVLCVVGEVCRQTLREVDIVGRIGGEEFAILLPESEVRQAAEVAERLRQAIAQAVIRLESGDELRFTVSIGVAPLSAAEVTIDHLLNQADKALYEAKRTGRNRVCTLVGD